MATEKAGKQMGATCDLIVRTQKRAESGERSHTALSLQPTLLCNGTYSTLSQTPAAEGAGPR